MYQFPVGVLPENFELNSVQVANPYQRALLSKTLRCEKQIHWLFQKSILSITQKSEMWCFPIKPTQNVSLLLNCFGFVQLFFKQYVQYIAFYICTHTQYTVPRFFLQPFQGLGFRCSNDPHRTEQRDAETPCPKCSCYWYWWPSSPHVPVGTCFVEKSHKKLLKTNTLLLNMAGWIIEICFWGKIGLCSEALSVSF